MRALLIFWAIITIVIFFMPFILGATIFFVIIIALLALFASLGILPGVTLRRYRRIKNDAARAARRTRERSGREERVWEENKGWNGFNDEGEIINLPETALRKDERDRPRPPGPFSE
jgi:hypothetical protein